MTDRIINEEPLNTISKIVTRKGYGSLVRCTIHSRILSDELTDAYRNGYTDGQITGNAEGRRNMLNEIYQHVKKFCDPMTEDYLQSLRGAP